MVMDYNSKNYFLRQLEQVEAVEVEAKKVEEDEI